MASELAIPTTHYLLRLSIEISLSNSCLSEVL